MLEGRLAEAEDAFRAVMEEDVAAFNRRMAGRLPAITDPATERPIS
jgi:formiminotetrahydrofolate cyclodeaminase